MLPSSGKTPQVGPSSFGALDEPSPAFKGSLKQQNPSDMGLCPENWVGDGEGGVNRGNPVLPLP